MYRPASPRPTTAIPLLTTDAPASSHQEPLPAAPDEETPVFVTGGNRPKAISCPTPVHYATLHLPTVLETIVEKRSAYSLRPVRSSPVYRRRPSPDRRYDIPAHCGLGRAPGSLLDARPDCLCAGSDGSDGLGPASPDARPACLCAGSDGSDDRDGWASDLYDGGVGTQWRDRGVDGAADRPVSVGRSDEWEMQPILRDRAVGRGALGAAAEREGCRGARPKRAWTRRLAYWLGCGAERIESPESDCAWPVDGRLRGQRGLVV